MSGGIQYGFVVFLEDGELMLECFSFGNESMPEGFRDRQVDIEELADR